MKLGVFVDLCHLGDGMSFADHTARTIERLVAAEHLGLDAVWFTEHHAFADGYLPQPLVLAAAVAARTSRVRLGTGVVLAPLRHPRHIAEEAALVDVDGAVTAVQDLVAARPVEHVFVWLSVGDMPVDMVERHIELWCGPVRAALAGSRV